MTDGIKPALTQLWRQTVKQTAFLQAYEQFGATVLTTVGGNPDLKPEDADTFTAGFVWDIGSADNLQLTVDYYDIDIENAIQRIPVQRSCLSAITQRKSIAPILQSGAFHERFFNWRY